MKPLDSEYRKRYQEFHLVDGTIEDSRQINWRDVKWDEVTKIVTFMNKKIHVMETESEDFKCFMCFRWAGREAIYEEQKFIRHQLINIWTVGWTDGKNHYLTDIDFYSGNVVKKYTTPLKEFRAHVHPTITAEKLGIEE